MRSAEFIALLAAVAPSTFAQTFSACKNDLPSCPDNPAQKDAVFNTNFGGSGSPPAGWVQAQCKGNIGYGGNDASLTVASSGDCPSLQTENYVLFGLFEVRMRAAPGAGIVSSIVMESDALDEVDWEFIGGEDYRVQSNYFGKGDTSSYDRMVYVPIANNQNEFNTYSVNWTSSAITWLVNGAAVRTLTYDEAKGGTRFPQTPMRLKVGIWAGGDPNGNAEGTVTWAMGGQPGSVDYAAGPFSMYVDSINIVNYSPAETYKYGDNSGNWQSIQVIGGSTGGVVSPEQVEAEQSTLSRSIFETTTGSAPPIQPLATASAVNSTAALSTTVTDGTTLVAAPTPAAGAEQGADSGAATSRASSASASSRPTQASDSGASSVQLASSVFGAGMVAMVLSLIF